MIKKSSKKPSASPKAGASRARPSRTKAPAPQTELALALTSDASDLLGQLAAESGCSMHELASELLLQQLTRRARQKQKGTLFQQAAPLDAFLEEVASPPAYDCNGFFADDATSSDHLSFKKISERQKKQSRKLGTLFDDLDL